MTEYCITKEKKINKFYDFTTLCSFLISNPLYFSYLIFFSPFLLKLLSFLSPLFITTSLLLLSLLTTLIPLQSITESKEGFFIASYNTLLEKLHPQFDNEGEKLLALEEFEVYKIVFETPMIDEIGRKPDENEIFEENADENLQENFPQVKETGDQCESLTICPKTGDTKPNKVKEEVKKYEALLTTRSGSEANKVVINEGQKPKVRSLRVDHDKKLFEAFSQTVDSPSYLSSFGSMRKEKEWRRTLACKLFEERHNSSNKDGNFGNGEEGMDLLWETYETESNRAKPKAEMIKKGRKKGRIEDLMVIHDDTDGDYGADEDYDDDNGKICCLQALKLSAGKMNLSMGRPNLVKIGKAFKGMGWLHSHVRRQGKKGNKKLNMCTSISECVITEKR